MLSEGVRCDEKRTENFRCDEKETRVFLLRQKERGERAPLG